MSRIGKVPVSIPSSVSTDLVLNKLIVKGPLGVLSYEFNQEVTLNIESDLLIIKPANDTKRAKAMWGLSRSLASNMVRGVAEGFTASLSISGVGYRAAVDKNILTMFLGFSHEIKYLIPDGISIVYDTKANTLEIKGINKQKVGQVAAEIMRIRPVEPYKGKGIRYTDAFVRRKSGKKK
jgi:large subunit ribosomal protein L6